MQLLELVGKSRFVLLMFIAVKMKSLGEIQKPFFRGYPL